MVAINTILPNKVNSVIYIPDDIIADIVIIIASKVVTDRNGKFVLVAGLIDIEKTKVHINQSTDDVVTTIINTQYISNILLQEISPTLKKYHQLYSHTELGINIQLIKHLVIELHKDLFFLIALNQELHETDHVTTNNKLINFDDSNITQMDQSSYDVTKQIISTLTIKS